MSNDYGVQVSMTINGDLYNVRGADPDEFEANLKGLADRSASVHDSLTTFKQAGVATGVFTGTAPGSAPVQPEPARSAGSPPPTSGPPECEGGHGPMKDLSGKTNKKGEPYRNRYYCSKFGSDCKPRD